MRYVESWCRRAKVELHGVDERLPQLLPELLALITVGDHGLGHENLRAMLGELSDHFDVHLDAFCHARDELDAVAVRELCSGGLIALAALLLTRAAQLSQRPLEVRDLYPGRLLVDLVDSALGRPRSAFEARLFEGTRALRPGLWRALELTLAATVEHTQGWRRWPHPALALEVCVALVGVDEAWQAAVASERARWRGTQHVVVRRDPAYHRARRWWQLSQQLFTRLTVPRGELRLGLEQGVAAVCRCARGRSRAASELVVLEVFATAEEVLAGPRCSGRLEVGQPARRKRLQRARLDALGGWAPAVDDGSWGAFSADLGQLAAQLGEWGGSECRRA